MWGPGFEQEGAGGGGERGKTAGATQSVRGNYKSFLDICIIPLVRIYTNEGFPHQR